MRFPHRVGSIRPRDREMSTGFSRDTPITAGVAFNRVNQRFDQRHSPDSRRISDRRAIRSVRVGPVDRGDRRGSCGLAANAIANTVNERDLQLLGIYIRTSRVYAHGGKGEPDDTDQTRRRLSDRGRTLI